MNPPAVAAPRVFRTLLRAEDPVVRDHRVHERRVMPGVTFLDLFQRAAQACGHTAGSIAFHHLVFPEAIAIAEGETQQLEITITPVGVHWEVIARSRPHPAGPLGLEQEWTVNARAEWHRTSPAPAAQFDLAACRARATRVADATELYALLRERGIRHFEFMQPNGQVWQSPEGALAEVRLSAPAAPHARHFSLHPAFLDFATGVSSFAGYADARYREGPFIPISIERFHAVAPLGGHCFIWVPRRETAEIAGADVGRDPEISIYSPQGDLLARFDNLTFKRIRTTASLGRKSPAARPPAQPAPATTTPPSPAGSPAAPGPSAEAALTALVAAALGADPATLDPNAGFYDLGLESTDLLTLAGQLESRVGQALYPTLLFEYPSIRQLAGHLAEKHAAAFAQATIAPAAPPAPAPSSPPEIAEPPHLHAFAFGWAEPATAAPTPPRTAAPGRVWLVFAPDEDCVRRLDAARPAAAAAAAPAVTVCAGEEFRRTGPFSFQLRPAAGDDYQRLVAELGASGLQVAGLLHFWSYQWAPLDAAAVQAQVDTGLRALFGLSRALLARNQGGPVPLLCFHREGTPEPAFWALAGFFASLRLEAPHLEGRVVGLPFDPAAPQAAWPLAWAEAGRTETAPAVRLTAGGRQVWRAHATRLGPAAAAGTPAVSVFRRHGIYLITGGAGGLGRSLAAHLIQHHAARVILLGRSAATPALLERLPPPSPEGGEAHYLSADISQPDQLAAALSAARQRFGAVHGVFHAAGVLHDGVVLNLTPEAFDAVLRPKIDGTLALDVATRDEPLDFFVLFSSLSAVAGNRGQAVYAAGNRFLDGFAHWRDAQVRAGSRRGRTVSINWPLWAEGGMQVSARTADRLAQATGMLPLAPAAGWTALEEILAAGLTSCAVAFGDRQKIFATLGAAVDAPPAATPAIPATPAVSAGTEVRDEDIAIIGASGRYPQARDLAEFHANLAQGRDCISEIPAARWDHRAYFDPDRNHRGKCYSQWGGFIDDVDRFDPFFFNISPREAELMDPQERLFLETTWCALEDAGYSRGSLAKPGLDRQVGVFVGVMWGGYQLFGAEALMQGRVVTANSPYWSVANRISYYFDLSGPSLAVDTACSSSLTALHLACESLRRGECRLAVVGGVNLSLHPTKYLLLSQMGMLSTHGRCKTFAADADGYTPGEGVGALVVKRLRDALADGDTIHAVVKGSAVNHDGRGNGFTVPNPQAQARVIASALEQAGVSPRAISYLEAHGTGTSLGDPIEIAGLTRAYRAHTPDLGFCAIGSVKSVIGHLEAAAGISAVTKVLLQFRHRQLFPTLHADTLNPSITFSETPFRVQRTLADWPRPRRAVAGGWQEEPRLAGISSFGAGGANVHVILEEPPAPAPRPTPGRVPPVLVLSAQNRDRLLAVALRLRSHLATQAVDLSDLLFTLQSGREPLDERLALVVRDPAEIVAQLDAFAAGRPVEGLWTGTFTRQAPPPDRAEADAVTAAWLAGTELSPSDFAPLARCWATGGAIDWPALARGPLRRIPLPTYPFAGKRYWVPRAETPVAPAPVAPAIAPTPAAALQAPSQPTLAYSAAPLTTLFKPGWSERAATPSVRPAGPVVLLSDDPALAEALARQLAPHAVIAVRTGEVFAAHGKTDFTLRPDAGADYPRLFAALASDHAPLSAVLVHASDPAWTPARLAAAAPPPAPQLLETLFHLGRALPAAVAPDSLRILVFSTGVDGRHALAAAAGGLLRSLRLEQPRLRPGVLLTDTVDPAATAAALAAELGTADLEIRLQGGRRLGRDWIPCDPQADLAHLPTASAPAGPGAIVLTGGAGGIGLLLARHLAAAGPARLAILGRSPLPTAATWASVPTATLSPAARQKVEAFAEIERQGGEVLYLPADITHEAPLAAALATVRRRFGRIAGLVHAAGITADRALTRQSLEAFQSVLAPKIRGTLLLDRLTRDDALDFVVLFSSVTAITGNLGQCDYAAGNAFLDEFAALRENWRARGLRHGRTLSINWPLWREGGMHADPDVARALAQRGVAQLGAAEGIQVFDTARTLLTPQVLAWAGDPAAFHAAAAPVSPPPAPARADPAAPSAPAALLRHLADRFAAVLKVDPAELDPHRDFGDFGIDSIAIKELVQQLNRDLGDLLDPFVMAEQPTLHRLAAHLGTLGARLPGPAHDSPASPPPPPIDAAPAVPASAPTPLAAAPAPAPTADEEIAVIGLAGKFPGAEDLTEFWENLLHGRQAIREVPADRWAVEQHFDPNPAGSGKSYSKWGGFIDGIDLFDPEFFGLSEAAAAAMDPLHRLFLEVSTRALEHAGYRKETLADRIAGVFVGAKQGTYAEAVGLDRLLAAAPGEAWRYNSACMIPNRVAEFHGLRGPAYVIDTACSSSLVAVHAACASLRRGECEIALAGGVEALVGPTAFIHFSQSKSLSARGECRPFESGADGTVLGEGAGAVVLKPLTAALRDGDQIHAVIRGSAVNNFGGAPDAPAQVAAMTRVMQDACRQARVQDGEIGYLELHGEGSLLRDALELRAIKEIWQQAKPAPAPTCPIGSVKGNIGHLLLASGIAGFVKACLMLSHRRIPPHRAGAELARYAGLADTPYHFAPAPADWAPPAVGARRTLGINATGIAGTNCFVVCSEWPHPTPARALAPRPMHRRRFWLPLPPVAAAPTLSCPPSIPVTAVPADPAPLEPYSSPTPTPATAAGPALAYFEGELGEICRRILRTPSVDPNTSFFELGMDSFKILQLFHEVARVFNHEIDPTRLADFPSLSRLARHLHAVAASGPAPVAVAPAPDPSRPPLARPAVPCTCATHAGLSLRNDAASAPPQPARTGPAAATGQDLDFGLYFFANYDHAVVSNKYRLLLDAVRFADAHGFASVFTPERHFEDFGGLYPNPAVVGAALAATTRQIQIRAGSIVSPLHDPLCLAEDWSMVDNLSDGRAGVAFTYGWQCDDFVLAPDRYLDRHAQMFAQIATIRKLWRGEAIERENGLGRKVSIRTYPRPIQQEIPIWVTCAISRDSFVNAGRIGANVVTFLLGQGLGDLQEKIAAYRAALAESGFDPEQGRVSLMVHTYLGENVESVKRTVREPFLTFIRAQTQLARNLVRSVDPSSDISDPKIINALMDIGFERFFGESGLMGTVATCRESAKRFRALGVDELSCLVDFGLDYDTVMASLHRLAELKDSFAPSRKPRSLFPDHRARGGTVPVAFTPIAPPAAAPTASAPDRNGAAGDSFNARLDTFRSYLPGGNCVPGTPSLLPAPAGPATRNGGTAHPYPVSGGNGHAAPASPPPESLHEPFPLTAVQQAYWMGRNPQLELGATSTHGYVELRVALDLTRFQSALQRVIDRHPMLRAVVPSGREQRVLPGRLEYRMEIVDLSGLGAAEQERRLRAERERQSHRVFDPATWPLFDFKAFILRPGQQYLLFGFDSLIADASSLTLVFREIMDLHDHPGRELAPIGFTFRDYLHGYGEFRKSAAYLRDRAFWLERIPSLPPAPDVPLRKLPAEVSQPRFLRLDATIEQAVWQEAKAAAKRHLVTPTVLLFTAFAQVLAEVGSRQSFSLNLTVFNRLPLHPDVNRIVGDFTALMLVAAEYRPEMTFWKNAATLQGAVLQALGHRYFDGVEVIKELARQRNLLGRAVIPVVFTSNLLNTENGEDGLSAMGEVAYMITQTTQAYLDNQVAENRHGLYIAWDYVAELFEPAVINGMFQRYVRIVAELGGATPPPPVLPPVHSQPELSPLEAFVARYNATDDPSLVPTTLAALFHAQVERTPEGAAVRFGSEVLTYRDLDRRSNQVAHYLHTRGVGRGDLVGLITPRCVATIVNTLGIVKSGAAYVPVDPEYPESRQRYILEKAGAAVVLTPALTAEICRDNPATPFPCPSRPEDLAYIIFTSGSTGQPKGVMITHAAVTNTLLDLNRRFAVGPADRVLGLSSMCFDLSVYDVFGTLAAGACLVLIDDIRNPEHLVRTVRDQRITLWNSVPTLFRMMVDAATGPNPAPDLRLALLSGDWIPITLPSDARRRFPTTEIYSLGGATEASIWSILFPIAEVEPQWTSIPYGFPLANQRFYVLDDDLAFCPVGTPGQLFIGGVGLSTGYFKDPEKTAAAYFTHPRLGRLYRTGDWGVWRESGYIEFLGRRDHQVKIRGFRVELGEIEARLLKHPGIKQAVVLDRTDARGNRSLCAYLVPRLAPTPSA